MKKLCTILTASFMLAACNSGSIGNEASNSAQPHPTVNTIPASYSCLPNTTPNNTTYTPQIAHASQCDVASASESSNLQSMAVALMRQNGIDNYGRYCTATPISYNVSTGIGFVLTAAHCVTGGNKNANTPISTSNITIYNNGSYIYQGTDGVSKFEDLTGEIVSTYVVSQYCQVPTSTSSRGCSDITQLNGDVAILKIQTQPEKVLNYSPQVQLAAANFNPPNPSYILALGYGLTDTDKGNKNLYYVNYQFFGTNSYQGETSQSTIMNGYLNSTTNMYSNIICSGDSGGGDFYWDNNKWNLLGVHSYGESICGKSSRFYSGAEDVSADVRPFSSSIMNIVNNDAASPNCDKNLANKSGFICLDKP